MLRVQMFLLLLYYTVILILTLICLFHCKKLNAIFKFRLSQFSFLLVSVGLKATWQKTSEKKQETQTAFWADVRILSCF